MNMLMLRKMRYAEPSARTNIRQWSTQKINKCQSKVKFELKLNIDNTFSSLKIYA